LSEIVQNVFYGVKLLEIVRLRDVYLELTKTNVETQLTESKASCRLKKVDNKVVLLVNSPYTNVIKVPFYF